MPIRRIALLATTGLVGIIGLGTLFGTSYTIDQGEVGIVLRNGAVTSTSGPGWHFKAPWIEDVVKIEVRQQKWTSPTDSDGHGQMEAYSKDLQPANLRITINYSINAAGAADLYANYGTGYLDNIVIPAVYSGAKIAFGHYDAATAIANRGAMVEEMEKTIQAAITTPNIHIDALQLEDISFSAQFIHAVEERQQQEIQVQQRQQVLAQEVINANIVRTKANGDADALRANAQAAADAVTYDAKAQANKTRIMGEAEADAIRARSEALKSNPSLVSLTAVEKWDGRLPSTMVPGSTVPFLSVQPQSASSQ